jgi:hypothetical protein
MEIDSNFFQFRVRFKTSSNRSSQDFQVGDILSIPLKAHTKHFFVYVGSGLTVGWGIREKKLSLNPEGIVDWKQLKKVNERYLWHDLFGLKKITLERRTKVDLQFIKDRINLINPGISYHLLYRNCEHFAYYVTAQDIRSEQSVSHLFSAYLPFTSNPTIKTLAELKSALLKCRFCGDLILNKKDFANTVLVAQLLDGYYVYYLNHWSSSQQLYVTTISKADNFIASYNSICLTYYGLLVGRGELLNIVRQLRGC